PGRRPELRLGARDPVRVLQPRLRDPRRGPHPGHPPTPSHVLSAHAAPPHGVGVARLPPPLGRTSSGFEAAEFDARQLARGYRPGAGGWSELAPDGCGAFAPMGGVFSCVTDLARWVSGFTGAFPPGEPGAGAAHPLARATRREMQLPQVTLPPPPLARLPGDPAEGGPARC